MTKQEIRDYNCGNLSWVKSLTKQQDEGAWNKCKKKIIWTPNYAKTCDKNKSLDVSQGYDLLTRPENFFRAAMKNQSISRGDGRSRKSQGGGWYAVSIATVF